MDSWILTAREAVQRSSVVREDLREEATEMLANGEYEAARRIFDDILQETMPAVEHLADASINCRRRIHSEITGVGMVHSRALKRWTTTQDSKGSCCMRVRCPTCGNDLKRRNAGRHLFACAERNRCGCPPDDEYCPRSWYTQVSDLYRVNPELADCRPARNLTGTPSGFMPNP